MSDTSFTSERSIEINDDQQVEVREAGVQTCVGSLSPTSDESDDSFPVYTAGGDYMGHPRVPWEEKLIQAKTFKQDGNEKYKNGTYKAAIGKYHRALLYLKGIKDAQQGSPLMPVMEDTELSKAVPPAAENEIKQLQIDCLNNLSACILRSTSPVYARVAQYCDDVLDLSPTNTKALFRKGVAHFHMKEPEKAIHALEKAQKQPNGEADGNIKRYLRMSLVALSEQDKKLKKTYQAMFEKLGINDSGSEEDVFTDNVNDPNLVKPVRKLEKASSVA